MKVFSHTIVLFLLKHTFNSWGLQYNNVSKAQQRDGPDVHLVLNGRKDGLQSGQDGREELCPHIAQLLQQHIAALLSNVLSQYYHTFH